MTPPVELQTPGGKLNLFQELYRGVNTPEEFNERTLKYVRMIQGSVLNTANELPLQSLRRFEWVAFEKLYRYGIPYDLVRRGFLESGGLVCGGGTDVGGAKSELCLQKDEASHVHDWSERSIFSVIVMFVVLAGAFLARMTVPNGRRARDPFTATSPLSFPLVLLIDVLSMASLAIIPVFSYLVDLGWAPLAAVLTLAVYRDWRLGALMLVKELLPVIDFIPLATILWMFSASRRTVAFSFLLGTIALVGGAGLALRRLGMITINV